MVICNKSIKCCIVSGINKEKAKKLQLKGYVLDKILQSLKH